MRWLIASLGVLGLVLHSTLSAKAATESDGRIQGNPDYYFLE